MSARCLLVESIYFSRFDRFSYEKGMYVRSAKIEIIHIRIGSDEGSRALKKVSVA